VYVVKTHLARKGVFEDDFPLNELDKGRDLHSSTLSSSQLVVTAPQDVLEYVTETPTVSVPLLVSHLCTHARLYVLLPCAPASTFDDYIVCAVCVSVSVRK
jgi:hypothetical protein